MSQIIINTVIDTDSDPVLVRFPHKKGATTLRANADRYVYLCHELPGGHQVPQWLSNAHPAYISNLLVNSGMAAAEVNRALLDYTGKTSDGQSYRSILASAFNTALGVDLP